MTYCKGVWRIHFCGKIMILFSFEICIIPFFRWRHFLLFLIITQYLFLFTVGQSLSGSRSISSGECLTQHRFSKNGYWCCYSNCTGYYWRSVLSCTACPPGKFFQLDLLPGIYAEEEWRRSSQSSLTKWEESSFDLNLEFSFS